MAAPDPWQLPYRWLRVKVGVKPEEMLSQQQSLVQCHFWGTNRQDEQGSHCLELTRGFSACCLLHPMNPTAVGDGRYRPGTHQAHGAGSDDISRKRQLCTDLPVLIVYFISPLKKIRLR